MKSLLCLLVCFASALPLHSVEPRPNIIVMLIDDMGLMDTSVPMLTDATGQPKKYPLNDWYRTPNMERLAAQGIRFSTFYAQTTCSPTRISLLTGQNAARHRTTVWINPRQNNKGTYGPPEWNWAGLSQRSVTLPRLLKAAGYRTIHVGKGHFGPSGHEGEDPLHLGFDVNVGGHSAGQPGSYYARDNFAGKAGKNAFNAVPHLEKYHGTETFLTEALTLEARGHIAAAVQAQKPFFLYFPHYGVHGPHQSDPRFAPHYANSEKPKAAQAYATLVEGIDKSLGDMLDEVRRLGVAKDTLIIFLGDNGSDAPLGPELEHTSSAPLRGKKATFYEGGTRVPFIAAWAEPDATNKWQKHWPIAAGATQRQIATVMDLFPTILELTGLERPTGHEIDGVSLRPQLKGDRNAERPDFFLSHFPNEHRSSYFTSLRQGDWKVIYEYKPESPAVPRYQLFNLAADPFETRDLAASEHARLQEMMRFMVARLEQEKALYPVE
ncbi:MAG: sulfatase, partial [Roseimicrobium sp.]